MSVASCGVCVLILPELVATGSVDAFYLLNEQARWPLLKARLC